MDSKFNGEFRYYKDPQPVSKKRPVHATEYEREINEHMSRLFPGRTEKVFYERNPEFLQIDVHMLEAPTRTDFHVLYTVGMSAMPMKLPDELLPEFKPLERSELMMLLPAEWQLAIPQEGTVDNRLWWPVNLMKYISRFPHEYKTWLGWGHIIPNGENYEPYDETTRLSGAMPGALQEEISILKTKKGEQVNLYTLIPLYKEEMELAGREGTAVLAEKLSALKGYGMIVFPDRPNVALDME